MGFIMGTKIVGVITQKTVDYDYSEQDFLWKQMEEEFID